jgi:hypothetical protein
VQGAKERKSNTDREEATFVCKYLCKKGKGLKNLQRQTKKPEIAKFNIQKLITFLRPATDIGFEIKKCHCNAMQKMNIYS